MPPAYESNAANRTGCAVFCWAAHNCLAAPQGAYVVENVPRLACCQLAAGCHVCGQCAGRRAASADVDFALDSLTQLSVAKQPNAAMCGGARRPDHDIAPLWRGAYLLAESRYLLSSDKDML